MGDVRLSLRRSAPSTPASKSLFEKSLRRDAQGKQSATPHDGCIPLEQVERRHIERVLADSATLEEAAARLGISSTTLWRKRWGIE